MTLTQEEKEKNNIIISEFLGDTVKGGCKLSPSKTL
jgi:hypothetical protein